MYARIRGDIFKRTMIALTGGVKCSVNFMIVDNTVNVQANLNILVEKSMNTLENDGDKTSFTANIGSIINLIEEDSDVEIRVLGDVLSIRQSRFQYDAVRAPEDRADYSDLLNKAETPFSNSEVMDVLMQSRALDAVAKDLGGVKANINIVKGKAYIRYSNSALVLPMNSFGDAMLPMDAARVLTKFLRGNAAGFKYYKDIESGMMVLQLGDVTSAAITLFEPDLRDAAECEKYLSEMQDVLTVDFSSYCSTLECICSSYKQLTMEFIVCKNGLRFYIDDISAKFVAGSASERICSIKLSLNQISAMCKLFGDSSTCTIAVGGNKICLKQGSLGKRLLLAGLVY